VKKSVFCLIENRAQAESILENLKLLGFSTSEISFLLSIKPNTSKLPDTQNSQDPEGETSVGEMPMGSGAVLGWLVDIESLAVSVIGSFVAGGPILAPLEAAALGGVADGLIMGVLGEMGIPGHEAALYEAKIRARYTLVSVHTYGPEQVHAVKDLYTHAAGIDIHSSAERASVM
jgi:hypothetical protein